jgi:hypothetical protein
MQNSSKINQAMTLQIPIAAGGFPCPRQEATMILRMMKTLAMYTMQTAMAKAVFRSGLGGLEHGNVNNLPIISEPAATTVCVLAENNNGIYVILLCR